MSCPALGRTSSPRYADAKASLHGSLREVREVLLGKLEGLGEYDIRRPLTPTGTNLLGLIKHLSTGEARYKKPGLWRYVS